jgi:hypothetical protein
VVLVWVHQVHELQVSLWFPGSLQMIGIPRGKDFFLPWVHCLSSSTQTQHTLCGAHDLSSSPSFIPK